MKLNCLIVDDEPDARRLLEEYISETDFLALAGQAENPLRAGAMLKETKADLMFLDINMPRMSGIEFLKSSPSLPLTILTTAYTEYALDGFELDVIDYLVKPFPYQRFLKAVTKARDYYELQLNHPSVEKDDYFFVKSNGRIEKVRYDELLYVEAMQNYVVLHLEDRKLVVYHTMKGIESQLPARLFLKVHKSTLINLQKVKSIDGNEINLGSCKVTISQSLRDEVLHKILNDRMIRRT